MENRRAYFPLLLTNFAAAFYNLGVQWMAQVLVFENFGIRRSLVGIYIPAAITLIASILLYIRKPRGVGRALRGLGIAIQAATWMLIGFSRPHHLPLFWMWLELLLVLIYAMMAWHMLVESREATLNKSEARTYSRSLYD